MRTAELRNLCQQTLRCIESDAHEAGAWLRVDEPHWESVRTFFNIMRKEAENAIGILDRNTGRLSATRVCGFVTHLSTPCQMPWGHSEDHTPTESKNAK